ncbi:MAG: energy transducer TonB [Crocinitomicaceae bacterium]|nr:energy transducer TonB [Crocinitomicaceae bacterium]
MEVKKNVEADIERLKTPIICVGLLFVSSLVLASFSYTKAEVSGDLSKVDARSAAINYQQDVKKDEDTPPPPPPAVDAPLPVQEEIIEEENTETIPTPVVEVLPEIKVAEETVIEVQEEIIEFPDVEAGFPGGTAALQKWIVQNIQYPQTSIEMNEQGRVYLSFVVEADGSISNIAVERGVSADLDKEAKRVVRTMPKWTPGEAKGKKARVRCRLPINFTLN